MSKNMFITVQVNRANVDIEWLQYDEKLMRFDLSKDVTAEMVDMLLSTLISYNNIGGRHKEFVLKTLVKAMQKKELLLPGGVHFQDGEKHIYNGCCCGMEKWSEIADMLEANLSPWMGHDPNVCCSEREGIYYVSDVELVNTGKMYCYINEDGESFEYEPGITIDEALADEKCTVISYEKEIFMKLLSKLDEDFNDFVEYPLKERLLQLTSDSTAEAFVEAFCICFGRERE